MGKQALPRISPCPQCHAPMEQALCEECLEIRKPEKGDLAVCLVCAAPLIFTSALQHRVLTTAELVGMDKVDLRLIVEAQIGVAAKAVKH